MIQSNNPDLIDLETTGLRSTACSEALLVWHAHVLHGGSHGKKASGQASEEGEALENLMPIATLYLEQESEAL